MTPSAEVLQMIRDSLEDGDSLVEIAEQFVNDSNIEQYHPKLADILLRLDAVAQELVDYLGIE